MQPHSTTPLTDDELLHAWCGGDRRAGETLVAKHWSSIARFFTHRLGSDCEDLIQDTFIACLEGAQRYRGDSSFRAYLFGVARNKLLRCLRDKARDQRFFDPATASVAQTMRSYASVIAADRRRAQLMLALRELPIDTQTMLELHYWEGMSINEIATVVELPTNTVKTRMRRGRLQLATALER